MNEANNQIRMKKVLSGMKGQVFVPDVVLELSTRLILVTEWVDGVKLTKADPSEVCGGVLKSRAGMRAERQAGRQVGRHARVRPAARGSF